MKRLLEENSAIGFWIFFFVMGIGINSLNSLIWANSGRDLLFTGGFFTSAIMFIAGYLLVDYYKGNKKDGALKYTGLVFRKIYPALLGGVLLAFIVKNVIMGNGFTSVMKQFFDSIWEFLGLSSLTFGSLSGTSVLWNEPLWIFSAIIISSYILYYIVSKNEELFVFLAVLFIILIYGSSFINAFNIDIGLLRVMAAMCLGMLLYYIVEFIQKRNLNELQMMTLSIVHISLIMFIIYNWINGIYLNEITSAVIVYLLLGIVLINKDYISVLYNKFAMGKFLGNIAMYYYAAYIAFIALLAYLYPSMEYYGSIIFNILFTTCWAIIMMYLDEYFVRPVFFTKKKRSKKNSAKN